MPSTDGGPARGSQRRVHTSRSTASCVGSTVGTVAQANVRRWGHGSLPKALHGDSSDASSKREPDESVGCRPPKAGTVRGSAGHGCESSGGSWQVGTRCGRGSVGHFGVRGQSVDGPCRVDSLFGVSRDRHPGGDGTYACCAIRVGALKARVGRETGSARSVSANAAEVTVVVRRHGYQRGESFEGCECADGNACVRPGDLRVEGPLRDRNTANLVRQWDATSPCPTARLKPSRWCETTRAAPASQACGARVGGWKLQRERGPQSVRRRQGIHAEESHGRRMATSRLPRRTLRVRARSGGSMRCFTERRVCPTSKNLEVQRSNAKRTWRT
jgi:hypothetical protein